MLSNQENSAMRQQIKSNQHEIFVISIDEMDAIIKSSPKANSANIKSQWQKIKSKAELGVSYYASADDLRTLSKLVGDLGGFTTQAYVKTYGGKPHIILKGHPGLRKILTGTKYGIRNPKVVKLGLGKAGAINSARAGGILSIVLLSVYRVADYFLTDNTTLSRLVGSLATDVVKVGIATGASIAAAAAVGGFSIAIGPILAVVVIGIGVSWALGVADEQLGITDRVIDGLDDMAFNVKSNIDAKKAQAEDIAHDAINSLIDSALESARRIVVHTAQGYLQKYVPRNPRAF